MTRKNKLLGSVIAAAALFMATDASASLLTIGGGTSFSTPGSNDVLGAGKTLYDNATLTASGPVVLSFYFVGSESGFANTLNVGSNSHTEIDAAGVWPGTFKFSYTYAGGAVPMSFSSDGFVGSLGLGGASGGKSIALAYLSCVTGPTCVSGTASDTVLFALDDSGAGPDDNHDDYVGYVVATAVPLPAAFWLLGSALLGLVGIGRRRQA